MTPEIVGPMAGATDMTVEIKPIVLPRVSGGDSTAGAERALQPGQRLHCCVGPDSLICNAEVHVDSDRDDLAREQVPAGRAGGPMMGLSGQFVHV